MPEVQHRVIQVLQMVIQKYWVLSKRWVGLENDLTFIECPKTYLVTAELNSVLQQLNTGVMLVINKFCTIIRGFYAVEICEIHNIFGIYD